MINSLCSLNSGDSSRDDEVSLFFETIKITNKMKKLLGLLLFILPLYIMAQNKTYTVTVYNAVPSQCSSNHLKTADGSRIDTRALENGTLKWCAVSRDMLRNGYKYGDKIEILHADPLISGVYEIHDITAPRFKRHIDILMPRRINTGKWTEIKIRKINP